MSNPLYLQYNFNKLERNMFFGIRLFFCTIINNQLLGVKVVDEESVKRKCDELGIDYSLDDDNEWSVDFYFFELEFEKKNIENLKIKHPDTWEERWEKSRLLYQRPQLEQMDEYIRKQKGKSIKANNIHEKKTNYGTFKWFGDEQELAELIIELYLKEYIRLSGNPNLDAGLFKKLFSNISKEKLISFFKAQKLDENYDSLLYKRFSSDDYTAKFFNIKKVSETDKLRKSKVISKPILENKILWIWSGINCAHLIGTLTSKKWIISQSPINKILANKYISKIVKINFTVAGDIEKNLGGTFEGIPKKEN